MLKEKLMEDLKSAMKEKDEIKKNTVQMVRAGILQIEKDKGIEVEDNQIIDIIAKEVKKRKDAAIDFEKGGREDLVEKNNKEIEILIHSHQCHCRFFLIVVECLADIRRIVYHI